MPFVVRPSWRRAVGLYGAIAWLATMPVNAAQNCSAEATMCINLCAAPSIMGGGGSSNALSQGLQCINRCKAVEQRCEQDNEAEAAQQARAQQQADNASVLARQRAEQQLQAQRAAHDAARDQALRELARRYPGRAVVPASLVLPDLQAPPLQFVRNIPAGHAPAVIGETLYHVTPGSGGQFAGVQLKTGELRTFGIGRVAHWGAVTLPQGGRRLWVLEEAATEFYTLHVLDLEGRPLHPAVDTQIPVFGEPESRRAFRQSRTRHHAIQWREHDGVLYLWVGKRVETGPVKATRPLDTQPLAALAIDLGTGQVLQRRSFEKADSLVIRPPSPELGFPRVMAYTTSRSPALLTALDWATGETNAQLPVATSNIAGTRNKRPTNRNTIELADVHWASIYPLTRADPAIVEAVVDVETSAEYGTVTQVACFRLQGGAVMPAPGTCVSHPVARNSQASGKPAMSAKDERPQQAGSTYAVFDKAGVRLAGDLAAAALLTDDLAQLSPDGQVIETLDASGQRSFLSPKGYPLTRLNGAMLVSARHAPPGSSSYVQDRDYVQSLWMMRAPPPADMQALLAALPKDDYETQEAYQKRLAGVTAMAEVPVELLRYDADKQQQHFRVGVVAYQASLPVEQARRFRGLKQATLTGKVRPLTLDVVEWLAPMLSAENVPPQALKNLGLVPPETL
jgi:hypothetical protein